MAVIGAGPGGLACALALLGGHSSSSNKTMTVAVFERARELRPLGAALGLNTLGYAALQGLSPTLEGAVRAKSANPTTHILQAPDGAILYHDESMFKGTDMTWLSWHTLQSTLRDELQVVGAADGTIDSEILRVNHALVRMEEDDESGYVKLHFEHRGGGTSPVSSLTSSVIRARLVVGADGYQSVVRARLLNDGPPHYTGTMTWRGVLDRATVRQALVETGIADEYGLQQLDDTEEDGANVNISIIGQNKNFWIMDCGAGLMAWTGTALSESDQKTPSSAATALKVFDGWPRIVGALIQLTDPASIVESGVYDRDPAAMWRDPSSSLHRATLLGDAAHPMRPSLGLGSTMAFQDALCLAKALQSVDDLADAAALSEALATYESERIAATTPLVLQARKQGEASHDDDQAQKFLRVLQGARAAKAGGQTPPHAAMPPTATSDP